MVLRLVDTSGGSQHPSQCRAAAVLYEAGAVSSAAVA
jgi:hypothetical protein